MAQLTRVTDNSVRAFVCTKGAIALSVKVLTIRMLDETPKPRWCPLDKLNTDPTVAEENHRYMEACERGKLDV
jgi:hypothetical protein